MKFETPREQRIRLNKDPRWMNGLGEFTTMGVDDSAIKKLIERTLKASDEEVGPACVNVKVPPTIVMTEDFREPYVQGYRHALADVRKYLKVDNK